LWALDLIALFIGIFTGITTVIHLNVQHVNLRLVFWFFITLLLI
jgi:hypothetical protein